MRNMVLPKILVVEDDKINAFIIEKFLEEFFKIEIASNGTMALELAKSNQYQIILMDINLGDEELDGVEVMHRMRQQKNYTNTPFIATTAYAMAGDRDRFLNAGFDEYLPKPIKRQQLINAIYEKLNLAQENV